MSRFTTFCFLLLLSSASLLAKKGESIFDRWSHMDDKTITIRLNLDSLEGARMTADVLRGTVIDNGQEFGVDITVRGRFRRRTCALPPMKLQFDKDLLRLAGLNTHNDYKLVTHCTSDPAGQEALLREQLAYELYQTVDPTASFRTKLLTINYVNTADGSSTTSYAILIEDVDELENRLATKHCDECYNAPLAQYTNIERVALFQYMIGNGDYSTRLIRNLKLMQGDDGRLTAVPYDFDYSGLVDPTYAKRPVAERSLVWDFAAPADLEAATADFLPLQDDLLQQIDNFDELSKQSKRELSRYVKGFFHDLQNGRIGA